MRYLKNKEKKPIVSVIIPCFNLGQFVGEAIDSVLSQTFRDFEIIVVDDGSTDIATIKFFENFKKKGVTILRKENFGVAIARNFGILRARGKYILTLDADDIISPKYLEKTVSYFEKNSNVDFVSTWVQLFGEEKYIWKTRKTDPSVVLLENTISVATLFKKSCWEKVGGFDETINKIGYYEDWDFWIMLTKNGFVSEVIEEPLFFYRKRGNSMLEKANKKHRELMQFLLEKHGDLFNLYSKDLFLEKDWKLFESFSIFNKKIIELKEMMEEKNIMIEKKEKKILDLDKKLYLMEASKFWKLRNIYLSIKNFFSGKKILNKIEIAFLIIKRDGFLVFLKRLSKFIADLFVPKETIERRIIIKEKCLNKWPSDKPLVSIIIPCYNYGEFVVGAIESVVSQTFQNIEIIVINDGSTDKGTVDVLNNLSYPKTKIIHQENQGLAQTRNNGARMSRGKYICFLDADDLMMPTYIEKALVVLESDDNLGCVYSWLQCFGDDNSIWRTQDFDSFVIRKSNIASSHSVIRKSAWNAVFKLNNQGFLTKYNGYFEDWVFWIDMIRTGFGGQVIKECLIKYRIHKKSLSAIHKKGFDKKISELKADRIDFFKDNKLARHLQKKIHNQIKNLNLFENIKDSAFLKSEKSILFVVPWLVCGGVETVLLEKIRGLKANGFQVNIITTEESSNDWESKFLEVTPFVYHLPNYLSKNDYKDFIFYFINSRNIKQICGIHSSFFYLILSDMSKTFPKVKVFDVLHNDSSLGYYESAVKYDEYIQKHIVISNKIGNMLESCGVKNEKIGVVYNGVDTSNRFNPHDCLQEKTKMRISFLGRFSPEKRPLDFLRVAKEFLDDDSIQFFMGGDGELKKDIDFFIKKNKLKNVKLLGFVDPESFLAESDVLVLTSGVEGFPMVALEAMSMKNVVISTNVGEINKIIINNKNGFIIEEIGNILMIKEKINYFRSNRDKLREMQNYARKHIVENYNIEYMRKGYLEIFSNDN